MMRKTLTRASIILMFLGMSILTWQCTPEELASLLVSGDTTKLGWLGAQENTAQQEEDINLRDLGNSTLPSSIDLTGKFPPIGDQGSYGTCVAWAVGYNLRTYLFAQEHAYTSSQLSDQSKQFSPKDLFWAIDNSDKGEDCNGTNFEFALDLLISRGVARMSTVPYDALGDCTQKPSSTWTTDAGNYKIANYRRVDVTNTTQSIEDLKGYLAEGRPVVIGAALGGKFMSWGSGDVLTTDDDTYNGQHAYHAMILSGYDNSKGPNGAFRVVNSWSDGWGDNGYIWVDYKFFVKTFCFAAYVASNATTNPDENSDGNVDDGDLASGTDVMAWDCKDTDLLNNKNELDANNPQNRFIEYEAFNSGTTTISKTSDWNICYLYYNAYDAEDYGIIIYDAYTDDFGDNEFHYDEITDNAKKFNASQGFWNYVDIPSGKGVAETMGGTNFSFSYQMPKITGEYYLVLIADAFDVLKEVDENNNYFFLAANTDGDPITITNGVISGQPVDISTAKSKATRPGLFAKSLSGTVVTSKNVNSYTAKEIRSMINHHKKTGELQRKISQFKSVQKGGSNKFAKN